MVLFLFSCLNARAKSFAEFHSNLGEMLILERKSIQNRPAATTPRPDGQSDRNRSKNDSSIIETFPSAPDEAVSPQLDASRTLLTDEEISALLFDDLAEKKSLLTFFTEDPSDWQVFLSSEAGTGYADNPLYASYNPQQSLFAELSLEAFFLSQENTDHHALVYFYAEGKNFFELQEENLSCLALSQFDYSYSPGGVSHAVGFRALHTFNDQGMDFSEIGESNRMKVTVNKSEFAPFWKWSGKRGLVSKLETSVGMESMRGYADDKTEFGFAAIFEKTDGNLFDWSAKFYRERLDFKDRTPREGSGNAIEGNLAATKVGTRLTIKPIAVAPLFNGLKLSGRWEKASDGAGGYYDHDRFKFSASKTFSSGPWESALSAGFGKAWYSHRMIGENQLFQKDSFSLQFGITRKLDEFWKTYARWNHEKDRSNDPDYSYESNFWSVGVSWEK